MKKSLKLIVDSEKKLFLIEPQKGIAAKRLLANCCCIDERGGNSDRNKGQTPWDLLTPNVAVYFRRSVT